MTKDRSGGNHKTIFQVTSDTINNQNSSFDFVGWEMESDASAMMSKLAVENSAEDVKEIAKPLAMAYEKKFSEEIDCASSTLEMHVGHILSTFEENRILRIQSS